MKKIIRENLVAALFLLHIPAYFLMRSRSFLLPAVLAMMLGDIVVSAVQLRLFTRTDRSVRTFLPEFLRYFCGKLAAFLPDAAAYRLLEKQNHAGSVFWLAVCAVTALLCALVSLVTGIARTALYHKEK